MNFARTVLATIVAAVTPASGLAFSLHVQQVSWLRDDLSVYHETSDTGQFVALDQDDFDETTYDPENDQYVGYLNVVVSDSPGGSGDWVIKNFTVIVRDREDLDGRLPWSLEAPLPCASIEFLGACWVVASFTGQPLDRALTGNRSLQPVEQVTHLAGGMFDEEFPRLWVTTTAAHDLPVFAAKRGPIPRPLALDHHAYGSGDAGEKPGERIPITIKEKEVETVDEAPWMCAPAASARSLKYLAKAGKITLDDGIQAITDELKTDFKTGNNALGGKGTVFSDALAGSKAYNDRKRLGLEVRYEQFARGVLADLKAGADVTINYEIFQWKALPLQGLVRVPIEGHCAFVTGITPYKDASGAVQYYMIDSVSDINQGNRRAENVKRTYRVEENGTTLSVFDEQGRLRYFGQVDDRSGFLIKKKP
jgi:hypothetical protein